MLKKYVINVFIQSVGDDHLQKALPAHCLWGFCGF